MHQYQSTNAETKSCTARNSLVPSLEFLLHKKNQKMQILWDHGAISINLAPSNSIFSSTKLTLHLNLRVLKQKLKLWHKWTGLVPTLEFLLHFTAVMKEVSVVYWSIQHNQFIISHRKTHPAPLVRCIETNTKGLAAINTLAATLEFLLHSMELQHRLDRHCVPSKRCLIKGGQYDLKNKGLNRNQA